MRDKTYVSRFSDAPWLLKDNKPDIVVGGAGGIGSWLLLFLSRTNNYGHIYLYEMDNIDSTNMAGQFFHPKQIGQSKANAIRNNMGMFSDYVNVDVMGEFKQECPVGPIVMSGFDNMDARKLMFQKWKELEDREVFIDGRMIMEDGQIYTVTKGNEEKYEETLFDDKEVAEAACSMKATSHCGAHVASLMLASLNNYLANAYYYKDYVREVPFRYVFSFMPFLVEIDV